MPRAALFCGMFLSRVCLFILIFHWERMMTTKYYIVHMACSHTMSTKNMKRCSFGFILELPWNSCIGLWKGKENEGSCMSQGEDVWLEKNGRHFRETAFKWKARSHLASTVK